MLFLLYAHWWKREKTKTQPQLNDDDDDDDGGGDDANDQPFSTAKTF